MVAIHDPDLSTRADEQAWIVRARQGDPAAFAAIVQRYERQIYSFIYRMIGDADDAADLTQTTFLKAWQAIGKTNGALTVAAWFHRIASNACLDVLRRRQRLRWVPWEGPKHDQLLQSAPADTPEGAALSQETRRRVQRALDRMSHRHRLALLLREYEGLSCDEIGQVMRLSRSAVKSTLFRAREEFRVVVAASDPSLARQAATRPRTVTLEP